MGAAWWLALRHGEGRALRTRGRCARPDRVADARVLIRTDREPPSNLTYRTDFTKFEGPDCGPDRAPECTRAPGLRRNACGTASFLLLKVASCEGARYQQDYDLGHGRAWALGKMPSTRGRKRRANSHLAPLNVPIEMLHGDTLQHVLANYLCAGDLASAASTCKHLHAAVRAAANGNAESRLGCKLPTLPGRSSLDRLFWLEQRNATLDAFDVAQFEPPASTCNADGTDASFMVILHKPSGLLLSLCSLSNGWVRLVRGDAVARAAPGFVISESLFSEPRSAEHHLFISKFNELPARREMVYFGANDFASSHVAEQDMEPEETTTCLYLSAPRDATGAGPRTSAAPPNAHCAITVCSLAEWLRRGERDAPSQARTFSTWTLSTLKSEPGTISVKNNRMGVVTLPPSCILRLTKLGLVLPRAETTEPAQGELLLCAV